MMIKNTLKTILLGGSVLAMCGTMAQASQTVVLKNGDRISGTFAQSLNDGMIDITTSYGASMSVPLNQVMAVQNAAGEPVQMIVEPLEITQAEAEAAAAIEPVAGDPNAYEWKGRANIGGFVSDGNSNKKAVTGDAEISARNEKNRWIAGGDVNFANDEGVETENDQSLYGEYNRFINDKWFYGVRQEFEIDKVANLDLRSKTGPFVGHQFYEQDDLNLKVRLGANYIYEDFASGNTEEDIAAAWALNYDQTFMGDAVTLFHNHEFDVPVDPTSAFLFQSETGIRVPVAKSLVGTAQVDFDWDNEPAAGIKEEDTKYSVKLGYEW